MMSYTDDPIFMFSCYIKWWKKKYFVYEDKEKTVISTISNDIKK